MGYFWPISGLFGLEHASNDRRTNPVLLSICGPLFVMVDGADTRDQLVAAIEARGETMAALSRWLGRNDAYLQQYIKRGSPKRLPEDERRRLAQYLSIDERRLGARDPWKPGDPIDGDAASAAVIDHIAGDPYRG